MRNIERITVVGVGYIGLPTCVVLAQAGFHVHGVDVNPRILESLNAGKSPIDEPGLQDALDEARTRLSFSDRMEPADAFFICVTVPLVPGADGIERADIHIVESAADSIATVLKAGDLVVLESTSPPTTTRRIHQRLAKKTGLAYDSFHVVHCPERVIPGAMMKELRENDRLIGSPTPEAAALAKSIYDRLLTKGSVRVTDDVTAETAKVVENAYRDVNIAYANELSVLCEKLGIDVFELIALANCHPRVNIHTPGVGVGGHCIPVVPWYLIEQFPDDTTLMRTARTINDRKPLWVCERVEEIVAPPAQICVLGMTYKPDVDDLRDSPSVDFARELQSRGYRVTVCEPNAKTNTVFEFENLTLNQALQKDFIVITLAHREFKAAREQIAAVPHYDCVGLLK